MDCFLDFVRGLLNPDPEERWSASEAMKHPFITREQYKKPFNPRERSGVQSDADSEVSSSSTMRKSEQSDKAGGDKGGGQRNKLNFSEGAITGAINSDLLTTAQVDIKSGSFRPPILSVPDDYFKGFKFG